MDLTAEFFAGFDTRTDITARCPYLTSSPSWAAWWFGHGESEATPRFVFRKVSQSRGYTLRVVLPNRTDIVPWPDAASVRYYERHNGHVTA